MIWEFLPQWQLTPQFVWVSESKRQAGDSRAPMDGYTTLDLTARKLWPRGSLSLTGRNLFDANVQEASRGPETSTVAPIPGDLPQAGRSLTLEATLNW
jgi:iron complex outermembrane receptor protein